MNTSSHIVLYHTKILYQSERKFPNRSIIGVCADGAYRKRFRRTFTEFYNKKVDITQKLTSGFQVIPNRWKVERTFGWANFSRRLSKDYERTVSSSEMMFIISHAHTLLKRL